MKIDYEKPEIYTSNFVLHKAVYCHGCYSSFSAQTCSTNDSVDRLNADDTTLVKATETAEAANLTMQEVCMKSDAWLKKRRMKPTVEFLLLEF